MALAAKISSAELTAQVTNRFQDQYFEAALVNAPGTTYQPGVTDDAFLWASNWTAPLATIDRSSSTLLRMGIRRRWCWSGHQGNRVCPRRRRQLHAIFPCRTSLGQRKRCDPGLVGSAPGAGVDGQYTNIPMDSTSGSGVGMTVNLTISANGAATGDYLVEIANAGSGYTAGETVTILDGTLAGLGAITAGAGSLQFTVGTVNDSANPGQILAVAQTSNSVSLSAGNEAAFYWNLKQFGFYNP